MKLASRMAVILTLAVVSMLGVGVAQASAHTCGDVWCSGSDTSTRYDTQGTNPQLYMGEIGAYFREFGTPGNPPCPNAGNPDKTCFNTAAANAAESRSDADTGIGTQFYYLGGGANAGPEANYSSPYCWGWEQGYKAVQLMLDSPFANYPASVVALDIEQGSTLGWDSTDKAGNQDVVEGFRDYVEDFSPAKSGCTHAKNKTLDSQMMIYISPSNWNDDLGSSYHAPNTPIWTTTHCCTATYPGSYSGGNTAKWYGDSNYEWNWQFDENPDYDIAKEPWDLPHFDGYPIGD